MKENAAPRRIIISFDPGADARRDDGGFWIRRDLQCYVRIMGEAIESANACYM